MSDVAGQGNAERDGDADAIVAEDLRKAFAGPPPVEALKGVSLRVGHGQLCALVGPDGAGKTTLMRMIAGLMKPDDGQLQVLGLDAAAQPQAVQDRISYMPQRFGLYEDLSVQENLDLYADLHGVVGTQRSQRYARLLEMTDLGRFTNRPAGKLSGGMKQKLGLACTLVRSPDLLLLDEPTVGVDPLSRRELWDIVEQLVHEEALSVLVSTAYMDEAQRCAQVFVLHEGHLLASGTPDALRDPARGRCRQVWPVAGEHPRELQARLLDAGDAVIDAVPVGGAVRYIVRDDGDARVEPCLGGAAPIEVDARLEDGVLALLRGASRVVQATVAFGAASTATTSADEPVIEVHDLVRRFGDFTAVANTSFAVQRGEIFGLLGPNGAGKTTTFRMLCGLLPASGGRLRVAGVDLRAARAAARRRIGYVAQKFSLYGDLAVRENLEFFGGVYGLRGSRLATRIDAVLEQFELAPQRDAQAGLLPGGFKQRLAMAAGLLHEPEILFLDEPTSGIDPLARRAFWRRITALANAGVTIIVTTHFMEEAEYCDRILIQDAGRVLAIGTPQAVREQADADDMNAAFIGIVERARAATQTARAA